MGKGRYFFYLSNLIDVKKVLVYLKQQAALRNAETLEGCLFIADYVIKYTLKYFSETFEEEIGFFHAEAEGWKQAEYICTADTGKYMLFFQQFQTKFLYRFFKFKTDHQTTSANFFDLRELFQLRHQILTYLGCIFNQILLTYYVQDSKPLRCMPGDYRRK